MKTNIEARITCLFISQTFVLILSHLSGTGTFCFADISGRNFFPGWGGGGARAPSALPLRTRLNLITKVLKIENFISDPSSHVHGKKLPRYGCVFQTIIFEVCKLAL